MIQHCPICSQPVVSIIGPDDADILIVGSQPTEDDLEFHKPFQGRIGGIFRKELRREAGIELSDCRQALLWYHAENKNEDCLQVSKDLILAEMLRVDYAILVGADAVKWLVQLSIDKVNGLNVTEYVNLDYKNVSTTFALVNPSSVYVRGVGELRFGLQNIRKLINENI